MNNRTYAKIAKKLKGTPKNKLSNLSTQLDFFLGESMGDIIPRTSPLDPCVPVSVYTAPDVLSLRFCSCVCNRGNSRELLQDYFSSSWRDFRRCDAGEPVPHQ